jgi:hypothetical protein
MEQTEFQLAKAVLLFYRIGPWTDADAAVWLSLTGQPEATTKTLCDLARRLLDDEADPLKQVEAAGKAIAAIKRAWGKNAL